MNQSELDKLLNQAEHWEFVFDKLVSQKVLNNTSTDMIMFMNYCKLYHKKTNLFNDMIQGQI